MQRSPCLCEACRATRLMRCIAVGCALGLALILVTLSLLLD